MASNIARGGRRRRVLNEELLNGTAFSVRGACVGEADEEAPRYGEQACPENHLLVSDLVPRRKRAVVTILLTGLGVAAGAEALAHYADRIAAAAPGVTASDLVERIAGGAIVWTSTMSLLGVALLSRLLFSLRRHRVDDLEGRYRAWRRVAWVGLLASINAVANIHVMFAAAMQSITGWSLTTGAAEWWIAPLALMGGWIAVGAALELRESRSSLAAAALALVAYVAAAVGALGLAPAPDAWGDSLTRLAPLVGHMFALTGVALFARYVILDVQGLVDHTPRRGRQKTPPAAEAAKLTAMETATDAPLAVTTVPMSSPAASAPKTSKPAIAAPSKPAVAAAPSLKPAVVRHDEWEDSEDNGEDEPYSTRKLSKADKKRLRKQNRAA